MVKITEFELKAIKALKRIPRGKITTYQEIAKYIGRPRAARAVGNALHKNPWAPAYPCHRVVEFNGELGGYAGGVKKKIGLLKKEGTLLTKGKISNFTKKLFIFK